MDDLEPVLAAVSSPPSRRNVAIDCVRGLAMVFMALDHTRDFLCNIPYSPEDIDKTWGFYFLVRWVTHFCAPAFFLLAGVGAYLYADRHSLGKLQGFLITRGLWLVVLEFTIIGFAWTFHPGWGMFGVICTLGLSMILLAAFVGLPRYLTVAVALVVIATHDLFDGLTPSNFHSAQWLLFLLHRSGRAHFNTSLGSFTLFVLFPLIPWCAVTLLGFGIGPLFRAGARDGRRTLLSIGGLACAVFVLLRLTNAYGNPTAAIAHSTPGEWHPMATVSKTLILFLDVEKYPPSLQYLLMTLGPIFLLLGLLVGPSSARLSATSPAGAGASTWDRFARAMTTSMATYGRVPLFYYILHLFAIHLAAALIGVLTHQPVAWLFHGGFFLNYPPDGYGHGLAFVGISWVAIVALLYWPCAWFARVKNAHPDSLLRFL